MTDTDPRIEEIYRRMLMERSPEERFLMGLSMCESARLTVLASLPQGLSTAERQVAIFRRYYEGDFTAEESAKIELALRESAAGAQ